MCAKVLKFALVGVALLCAVACHGMSAEAVARRTQNEKALARIKALEEAVAQKDDWLGRSATGEECVLREDLQEALFEGIRAAEIDADPMEELVLRLPVEPFDIYALRAKGPNTPIRGYGVRYIIENSSSKPRNDKQIYLYFTLDGVLHHVNTSGFALFDEAECDVTMGVPLPNGDVRIYGYTYPKGRSL